MFIISNALKNLSKNKGRSVLLGLLITVVLSATSLVISFRESAGKWLDSYLGSFGVEVGLATDWEYAQDHYVTEEKVLEDGSVEATSYFEADPISMEELENYADSELVQKAVLSGNVRFSSDGLDKVELDDNMIVLDGMSIEELCEVYGVKTEEELLSFMSKSELEQILSYKHDTVGMIYGYSDPEHIREFAEGRKKIAEGRFFEQKGEAIISEELAKKNNLKVGDRIKVSGGKQGDDREKELTIAGTYTNLYANANQADIWVGFEKNDIIVGYDTFRDLGFEGVNPFMDEIKYFVKDPGSVEAFEREVKGKGLPECYKLAYDTTEYENIAGPVTKAVSFAERFGKIVLLAGLGILVILTVINIRDRKYEIGVLRAIGMARSKVALGLITEILVIVAVSAALGITAGRLLVAPVMRLALPQGAAGAADVALSFGQVATVSAAALGFAFVAGLVSSLFITRYEPMKILRQAE